jgi:hypothetical protein
MQVSISSGIYTDSLANYRTSYPINLVPVPKQTGIAAGYLRKADGITLLNGDIRDGVDRGGINWRGVCYRVVGTQLLTVSASGVVAVIGTVAAGGQCSFAYSFTRLAVAAGGSLYYYDLSTLVRVTDPDLGVCNDVVFLDGYFLSTDGEFIVQTELSDPTAVNPLKYGSSEVDPDPLLSLITLRNELLAMNRHTIESFDNTGGDNFAFQRIEGALIEKGTVGTHASCRFAQSIAFVGGGRNEPPSVYIAGSGQAQKIATAEIERLLSGYTDAELAGIVCESREYNAHVHLLIHCPDRTMVYDVAASQALEQPIWFFLSSAQIGIDLYRARSAVYCYGKWIVGDALNGNIGYLDESVSTQYAVSVGWQFECGLLYNENKAAQVHSMELVTLGGRAPLGSNPQVFMSYTVDGMTWSDEKIRAQGLRGDYAHRLTWRRVVGRFQSTLGLRFRGCDDSLGAFTRLDIEIEGLTV